MDRPAGLLRRRARREGLIPGGLGGADHLAGLGAGLPDRGVPLTLAGRLSGGKLLCGGDHTDLSFPPVWSRVP